MAVLNFVGSAFVYQTFCSNLYVDRFLCTSIEQWFLTWGKSNHRGSVEIKMHTLCVRMSVLFITLIWFFTSGSASPSYSAAVHATSFGICLRGFHSPFAFTITVAIFEKPSGFLSLWWCWFHLPSSVDWDDWERRKFVMYAKMRINSEFSKLSAW